MESVNEDVTLIGWSLGATVSVLTSLKKPKNLKKLILIGFSPKFKDKEIGHNPVMIKAFMLALKIDFKDTVYNFRKTAVGDFFKNIPLPEKEGSIHLLKEFINTDITGRLKEIDLPTILIHGKKDKIINYQASVYSHKKIKNSELILTDCHHAPFMCKNQQNINDVIIFPQKF
nr:alpha/beta hydrolase [Persephonella hydrogeniphila]